MPRALISALVLMFVGPCFAQTDYPLADEPLTLTEGEVLVTPSEDWVGAVDVPQVAADQRLVLHLDARLDTGPGGGGCNWVLRVLLNGRRGGDGPRVIPCGHLGKWRSGIGRFGYDREIIEIPADRGTPTLRIDLREIAPALAGTVEGGVLSITPDRETVEYTIEP